MRLLPNNGWQCCSCQEWVHYFAKLIETILLREGVHEGAIFDKVFADCLDSEPDELFEVSDLL